MLHILKILVEMEYRVTFFATLLHGNLRQSNYLRALGVEPIDNLQDLGLFNKNRCWFDSIMIVRMSNFENYGHLIRERCPLAMIIFDTGMVTLRHHSLNGLHLN